MRLVIQCAGYVRKFIKDMFWKQKNKKITEKVRKDLEPQVRDEEVPGSLSLGWYYSEEKKFSVRGRELFKLNQL